MITRFFNSIVTLIYGNQNMQLKINNDSTTKNLQKNICSKFNLPTNTHLIAKSLHGNEFKIDNTLSSGSYTLYTEEKNKHSISLIANTNTTSSTDTVTSIATSTSTTTTIANSSPFPAILPLDADDDADDIDYEDNKIILYELIEFFNCTLVNAPIKDISQIISGYVSNFISLISKTGDFVLINQKFLKNVPPLLLFFDAGIEDIKVPLIATPILIKIVEYINHYKGVFPSERISKPLSHREFKLCLPKNRLWEADYINIDDKKIVYDIILAANYLDIKPLIDLGCSKVASWIKGKPIEQIKNILCK
jgi:hypothetical protein